MAIIGFIGAGNMGGALARAAAKCNENKILLADNDERKAVALADEISATVSTNIEICKTADYIFLGVKPQVLPQVLAEISPALGGKDFTLVSMAAGVTTEKIAALLGFDAPIIRIMPNLPVSVGEGMILYTLNKFVHKTNADALVNAMSFAGEWDQIDEALIDAASAVSGCGPAFAFMFANALAKGGESNGLPYDKALKYAAQTVKGAAEMLLQGGDAEQLTDAVCSPGGSTIEGVKVLENEDLSGMVNKTVTASYKRTIELGK
ncbi:MAG: pyrroline-5-carboxylate reductase [Ruminococcaceae bacterium]|nr:pyrroline-5-carboxylate reductase [Oscillospiraceae bacterium]